MSITLETRIGTIAAEHPLATRVFARHGIDFCCGGGRPLGKACEAKGLEGAAILDEVRGEIARPGEKPKNWSEAPLSDLIDHILQTYHHPLREELPRLESMARRVHDAHGARDPDKFRRLVSTVARLREEVESHMMKEEQVLFPMIRVGTGTGARAPISMMETEHDATGNALEELRNLTDGYRVPEEACNTWRALWVGLAELDHDMREHIHLESNILFPRALAG